MTIKDFFSPKNGAQDVYIFNVGEEWEEFTSVDEIRRSLDPMFDEDIQDWRYENDKYYLYI